MAFIFLLGGQDLEMQEIARLSAQQNVTSFDRSLDWNNALLSTYSDILKDYACFSYHIYGIELRTDITPPSNYTLIDHHNDFSSNPSSIEQVAKLLNIDLTFRQKLIAANDKSYIEGMKALGATDAQITEIRRADRKAQGVTELEEQQAKYALENLMRKEGNLTIVKSLTSSFSTICDYLYPCEHLLIYTKEEWVYYGKARNELITYFKKEITKKHIFYGGNTTGYIGLAKGYYNFDEIKRMINHIKNIVNHA